MTLFQTLDQITLVGPCKIRRQQSRLGQSANPVYFRMMGIASHRRRYVKFLSGSTCLFLRSVTTGKRTTGRIMTGSFTTATIKSGNKPAWRNRRIFASTFNLFKLNNRNNEKDIDTC